MKCKKCAGTGQIASPEEIKKRRKEAGIRQNRMARMMKISNCILSAMEHGHRSWNADLEKRFVTAIEKHKTKNL